MAAESVKKKKRRVAVPPVLGVPEYELDAEPVPIPQKRGGAKKIYFPFEAMDVGKSFTTRRVPLTVRGAIRRYRKEGNAEKQYIVRPMPDGGARCWRTR